MNFKHTGLFPEQAANWDFAREHIRSAGRPVSACSTCSPTPAGPPWPARRRGPACATWTRPRAWSPGPGRTPELSGLEDAPIRWIVDDCAKFVEREIRRGRRYDAVIMDPPSYGRGPSGEVWKLEENLCPFVELVSGVLSRRAPLCPHQLLHHGAGPVGAHLSSWSPSSARQLRRPHRERRAGPACHRHRPGPALRRHRALGGDRRRKRGITHGTHHMRPADHSQNGSSRFSYTAEEGVAPIVLDGVDLESSGRAPSWPCWATTAPASPPWPST